MVLPGDYRLLRVVAIVMTLVLILAVASPALGAARAPTKEEEARITDAAQFLEDMGHADWAENVRQWLKDGKIRIDADLNAHGSADREGRITIRGEHVAALSAEEAADPFKRFTAEATLAYVLLHEKVHAHQAPEGGALSDNIDPGDWNAGFDVYRQCVGPDPLELEAFYHQIRALYEWEKVLADRDSPEGLTEEEAQEVDRLRQQKMQWLRERARFWAERLKDHDFAKLGDEDRSLADGLDEIDENPDLTDEQKREQRIELLTNMISQLFQDDGAFERAREAYAEKRGEDSSETAVPKGTETALHYPDSDVVHARVTLAVGDDAVLYPMQPRDVDEQTLYLAIYRFGVPPDPDPGYAFVSPVYEIVWNSLGPIPFDIAINLSEDVRAEEVRMVATAMHRDHSPHGWTVLADQEFDQQTHFFSGRAEAATMFALAAPAPTFTDLPASHWAYDMVEMLVNRRVIDRTASFGPGEKVSRALFTRYLVRALDLRLTDHPSPFTDVPDTHPDARYISTAYHAGLVRGVGDDLFSPESILTREQSITMLLRAQGLEEDALVLGEEKVASLLDRFVDRDEGISGWARSYMAMAVKFGLVAGYPDGTVGGLRDLTHAEVSTLVYRQMFRE